ncbi:MAG: hypothetical protein DRQ40_08205 [Gammaproteobacteria bacterium]|nr:MAG: hypothetical protein DRQ40_08205 [Gammaproteobacteria bacterium]
MQEHIAHFVGHKADFIVMMVFGAVAHTAWQIKKAKLNKAVFTLIDGIISMIIAMFSGILFGLSAAASGQGELTVMVSVSVGSWLGITGLNYFANRFMQGK